MNTPVNFEIAKLLKEKGFDEKCSHYYINDFQNFKHDGKLHKTGLPQDLDNENIFQYVKRTKQPHLCNAPTIAEVVMWLYEKHDIYINVIPDLSSRHNLIDRKFYVSMFKYSMHINVQVEILKEDKNILYFNKLENAYEFGILHALKNLI